MSEIEEQLQRVNGLILPPEIFLKGRPIMDDTTSEIDDFVKAFGVGQNLLPRVLKVVNSNAIDSPESRVNPAHPQIQIIESTPAADNPNDAEIRAASGSKQEALGNLLDRAEVVFADSEPTSRV